MCNYLYYWVTVRNSQSYWHLEHMRETLACTRGWGGQGGVVWGNRSDGGGGWGYHTWSAHVVVCVSGWGWVFSLTSVDATALFGDIFLFFFPLFFFLILPKAVCISRFHFSGLWRIVMNNTSCCECTSNNQTLIVLLCCNVQFIYLYIYSEKRNGEKRKRKKKVILWTGFTQQHQRQGSKGVKNSNSR